MESYWAGTPLGRLGALFSPHGNGGGTHATQIIAAGQLKPAPELPQAPVDVLGFLTIYDTTR